MFAAPVRIGRTVAVRFLPAALPLLVWQLVLPAALADPIAYRFDGVGSGEVNGKPFRGAVFSITLSADTENVVEFEPNVFDVDGPATFSIAGVGNGTFQIPTRVFSNLALSEPAVGFSSSRQIGGGDLLDYFEQAFAGYKLDRAFGPVSESEPLSVMFQVPTDLGPLTMFEASKTTFVATIIPEPATLSLLLAMLVVPRRRR